MNITTAQDAIDRAIEFCRDIGYPIEADLVVHADYSPVTMSTWGASYWKPSWEISLRSSTDIGVDESGTISHFSLSMRGIAEASNTKIRPLTEADAREGASEIIAAMQLPEEVKAEEVKAEDLTAELKEENYSDDWWFTFHRTYEGMRCLYDSFVLVVNATTGRPSSARLNFHSFLPLSSETSIDEEHAVALAKRHLTTSSIKDFDYLAVKKYVVAPNNFLTSTDRDRMRARVAWVCFFIAPNYLYGVYIDVQTSDVLGGVLQCQMRQRL